MGCLLGIRFLQQGYPKGIGGGAAWEAESGIDAGQAVIDGHLRPASLLPKTKPEGASVLDVTPQRLVWWQNLKRVILFKYYNVLQHWATLLPIIQFSRLCTKPELLPYSVDVCSWAGRCRHRETSSLLISLALHGPGWCYQGGELATGRSPRGVKET